MFKTLIAGEAPSIQYQGVDDRSESRVVRLPANGVILGKFRRGRIDKPMWITTTNIRARLGFEPENPAYLAVADALDMGIGGVWVMNILDGESGDGTGGSEINCAGAISSAEFNDFLSNAPYVVELDGEVVETSGQPFGYSSAPELQALFEVDADGYYKVRNLDSVEHRVKLTPETYHPDLPTVIDSTPFMSAEPNPTITIDPDTGVITFCLAAGA